MTMTNSEPEAWYSTSNKDNNNRYSEDEQCYYQAEETSAGDDTDSYNIHTLQSNPNATNTLTTSSTSSTSSTMHSKTTPPRHNYHNPHTPIASIKRPRSTLKSRHRNNNNNASSNIPTGNNVATPRVPESKQEEQSMNTTTPSQDMSYSGVSTPARSSPDDTPLSPMHGVKPLKPDDIRDVPQQQQQEQRKSWVGQKVDALFSPVYQFLHHEEEEQKLKDLEAAEEEEHIMMDTTTSDFKDVDNDTQPTQSVSSSESSNEILKSSTQDSDCDDDVDGEYHDATNDHHFDSDDDEDDASMGRPVQPTDLDEFNPWQFIKALPPYERIAHTCPAVTLPPKAPGAPDKTLVLDLDETLVHCTVETPDTPADLTFPVAFHGVTYTVHVRLRPFLQTFLERIKGKYEVIVFTASQKVYADELLDLIDPKGVYVHHRLFRESCLAVDGNFLKDLNVLGRDLRKTVLVDNSPHAFGYQVDNGIPIESWFECPLDRELLKLERFLRTIRDVDDVRPIVRQKFQSYKLIDNAPSLYG